jgi:hypothetical protein
MRGIASSIGLSVCFASLYFILTFSFHLLGGIIEQPHPVYLEGHWFTNQIKKSSQFASLFAVFMFICVPIDLRCQRDFDPAKTVDIAYYPRFNKIREWIQNSDSRWTILLVVFYLTYYLAASLIEQWQIELSAGGLVWPPERVPYVCVLLWGTFWIADCFCRSSKGTIVAAFFFTLFVIVFATPINGFLRE